MANQQTLTGNWNEIKGRLREAWGQLTDSDLMRFNGDVDQLVGTIQQRTCEAREAIQTRLSGILEEGGSSLAALAAGFGDYTRQARESLAAAYGQAGSTLGRHPGVTVASAFGAGLIVGLIAGLSRRG